MSAGGLSQRAFDVIEKMIVLEEIAPASLISEKQLMDLTGIGRTPVREAVQRLARDQMVEILPWRGVMVAASSIESQLELLEVRRQLDPFTARLAAARSNATERRRARDLARSMSEHVGGDISEFVVKLREAHELAVTSARNDFLRAAMAPLQGLSRRFWFSRLTSPEIEISRAASLHAAVLVSIADHDEDRAFQTATNLIDYLVAFAFETLPPR